MEENEKNKRRLEGLLELISEIEKKLYLHHKNPSLLTNLEMAKTCYLTGETRRALKYWEKVFEGNSDYERAKIVLDSIRDKLYAEARRRDEE